MFTTHFSETARPYFGSELRPHFLLTELGIKGSALAAFIGPCEVETGQLVDWEDRLASDRIEARSMVHFLGEFFGAGLREGVFLQRLFIAQLCQRLAGHGAKRDGDDIFVGQRKLSVSIVTASPVSLLLHAGINIDPAGAPVPAVGLAELGVNPRSFAREALSDFEEEWRGIEWACAKVRPVV